MFLFQEGINVAVVLVEPVLVVSVSSTEDLQGSRVNDLPEGSPLLFDVVLVGLNVLEIAVQLHMQFLSSLMAFQFGCVEVFGNFLSLWYSLGLDKEVQFRYDQTMIRQAVCATHYLRLSNVLSVLGPCDDIDNDMPILRVRVLHEEYVLVMIRLCDAHSLRRVRYCCICPLHVFRLLYPRLDGRCQRVR